MVNPKKLTSPPNPRIVVPARSKVAVNKSVSNLREKRAKDPKANAGDEKVDEVFADNIEIAVALLPTVAFKCKFGVS